PGAEVEQPASLRFPLLPWQLMEANIRQKPGFAKMKRRAARRFFSFPSSHSLLVPKLQLGNAIIRQTSGLPPLN
ncbi:MAG: hypothetical protein WBQ36_04060, partial [Desulfobaccales bacterium]